MGRGHVALIQKRCESSSIFTESSKTKVVIKLLQVSLVKGIFLFPPSLINLETDREYTYESWYKASKNHVGGFVADVKCMYLLPLLKLNLQRI